MEEILKRSPEVILISSMNPRGDYEKVVHEWTRWKMLPAVKNGRIHKNSANRHKSVVNKALAKLS